MIKADPNRLSQVIDNLLNNAISYAGEGAQVKIVITPGEKTSIAVIDNGIGIPARHIPYIFDSFYRVDTVRTPGDRHSGLGLRIARGIIEAHNGTLTLQSEQGEGTRVEIIL
jgi:signal transduction histidine kinase